MTRERKRCPECRSTSISKVHGKTSPKSIPKEFRGITHYKCTVCNNRFFNPVFAKCKYNGVNARKIDYQAVLREYLKGKKDNEIAAKLNMGVNTVFKWRKRNNLPHNHWN